MTFEEIHIAVVGAVGAISGVVSYYFGAKKQKADAYRTITETYQYALESLRNEMIARDKKWELRIGEIEKDVQFFKGKACKNMNCEHRVKYDN
ncbi:MAG: hypothetical protein LBU90_07520 [Bacteroidales bacterium]|jgi:predicted amino acid dehydrogenase|nr:hypothetical protein [Bacteroidales bacterium]